MRRITPAIIAVVAVVLLGLLALVALVPSDDNPGGDDRQAAEETPPMRIGYVPYWDQRRGFDVVLRQADVFDQVSPVWYSLDASGGVVLADAEHTTVELNTVRRLQNLGIQVLPTVTNLFEGEWNPEVVQAMLHDDGAMRRHVRELVRLAVNRGYDGLDIDYEDLRGRDRDRYSEFVDRLATALHAEDKLLAVDVHPKTSEEGYDERNAAQDYEAIGAAADQVRLMTYDYSWDESAPGPVAPADWVEDVIEWTVTQIPPEKTVLGVVLLGYDWSQGQGRTVDFRQAQRRAQRHDAAIRRSPDGTPSFAYEDSSGRRHEVWYEDAVSAEAKLDLAVEYDLGGVFFWRLGGEDPDVWPAARTALRLQGNG